MKFLFCGLGSIGKRHIANLSLLPGNHTLSAFRSGFSKDDAFVAKYQIKTLHDYKEALKERPDAVFVTNPSSFHVDTALRAVDENCHLFIEKPLSSSLDGVDELIERVNRRQRTAMVGCNFRFNKGIRLIREMIQQNRIGRILSIRAQYGNYLPYWHPWDDYRNMYFAKERLGGGVVLDLIHEIDYIYWMLGSPKEIFAYSGKLSNLEIETEDFAEILLRYDDGKVASIHLDCIQRQAERNCRIVGEKGIITWDYFENEVRFFSEGMDNWQTVPLGAADPNDMYLEEMKHFISCLEGKEKPLVPLIEGKNALKIALAVKESSRNGKVVVWAS